MKTVPTPNQTEGRLSPPRVIVIHSTEAPEGPLTAENVANYFAQPSTKASAHVTVDNNSEVRSVADEDTAWAAPGANSDGLQLELAGYARQSRKDWLDDYSLKMLQRAVYVVAAWCKKYSIPPRRLTRAQLRAGEKGLTSHADVTAVYKRSDHTDPGEGFPWDWFITALREELEGKPKTTATKVEEQTLELTDMVPVGEYYASLFRGEKYPLSFVLIASMAEAKLAKHEAASARQEIANLSAQIARVETLIREKETRPQSEASGAFNGPSGP
ncbi:peptidoglycan recognition family protein [Actinocorallia libanotica]|uniref:N-acetylmuramoyl-L-alanine amidase n=1 Tax=Actinocorallia libanotica TaxID=46162 RepID=A0ABN1Q1X4_9ACTN